ncbi:AbiH family protein [Clostridium sporogenes]
MFGVRADNFYTEIHQYLRKDTKGALINHSDFFESLIDNVDSIYSFGFSYSKVDDIYIKDKNLTWYLNDFDDEKTRNEFADKIRRCGFEGKISTFHI